MRELRALFRKGLPPLIEELEKVTSELRLGETDVADEARRLAHQLKGSGGSFGYPKVTRAAREVLQSNLQEMVATLDTLLATMRYIVTDEGPAASQILVIDDDPLIQQCLPTDCDPRSVTLNHSSGLLVLSSILPSSLSSEAARAGVAVKARRPAARRTVNALLIMPIHRHEARSS
jgi:HPt (histidine-containing phosphotransfer) domain-containing protein